MRRGSRVLLCVAWALALFLAPATPQEPTDEISPESVSEWLRAALDESLAQDDPEITRALVDELGTDAAPLIPMVLAELDRVDPDTWFTARSVLARVAVFAPVGQPVPPVDLDPRVIDAFCAAHPEQRRHLTFTSRLRDRHSALATEEAGRSQVRPHDQPSQWISVLEESRDPFAVELAADLLRRAGQRSDPALDALARRLEEGIEEVWHGYGLRTKKALDIEQILAHTLSELAPDDPRAARALARIAFAKETTEPDRGRAVEALRRLGPRAEPALPWVRNALQGEGTVRSLEDALTLSAAFAERGLPLVGPLRRIAEQLQPESALATRITGIVTGIRDAATRRTLSLDGAEQVSPKALAIRAQVDGLLDELLTTDDPQRFDDLLERLVGLGRFTADALVDRILESAWSRDQDPAWWRTFTRLAIPLGPQANDAVRRLHAELALRPAEELVPVIRGLLHWHPWCHPFADSEYPLLDPGRYREPTAKRLTDILAKDGSGPERPLDDLDSGLRELEQPPAKEDESTGRALVRLLESRRPEPVLAAIARITGHGASVDAAVLGELEALSRAHSVKEFDLNEGNPWMAAICASSAAWALLAVAPQRLDARPEVESLFRMPQPSPQELTRAVRHLDSLDLAAPWARELLVTTARSVHQLHTPVLHRALLDALDDHRPLSADDLAGIDLSEDQRRRLESER